MDAICATLPRVAAERCPDMDDMAQAVANKYGRALMLYSKCHGQFNSSNTLFAEALVSLRKFRHTCIHINILHLFIAFFFTEPDIDEFLSHYRSAFPNTTITTKLHMVDRGPRGGGPRGGGPRGGVHTRRLEWGCWVNRVRKAFTPSWKCMLRVVEISPPHYFELKT